MALKKQKQGDGAKEYLLKPIEMQTMAEAVSRALGHGRPPGPGTSDRETAACGRCRTTVEISRGGWSAHDQWLCQDCLSEDESCGCSD